MILIVTLSSLSDEKYNALVSICPYVHLQDFNNTVECSFQKLQMHSHIYHEIHYYKIPWTMLVAMFIDIS